jgi:hypothetical protein
VRFRQGHTAVALACTRASFSPASATSRSHRKPLPRVHPAEIANEPYPAVRFPRMGSDPHVRTEVVLCLA